MLPCDTSSNPAIMLSKVDFPAPLSPTKAYDFPFSKLKLHSSKMFLLPFYKTFSSFITIGHLILKS